MMAGFDEVGNRGRLKGEEQGPALPFANEPRSLRGVTAHFRFFFKLKKKKKKRRRQRGGQRASLGIAIKDWQMKKP